jgi:hypothetical protein
MPIKGKKAKEMPANKTASKPERKSAQMLRRTPDRASRCRIYQEPFPCSSRRRGGVSGRGQLAVPMRRKFPFVVSVSTVADICLPCLLRSIPQVSSAHAVFRPGHVRLIDRACDTYCHGLARIEQLGPNRRLIFTVPSAEERGCQDVVVKLIVPAELLTTLAYMAAGADRETVSRDLIALETRIAN